LGGLKNTPAPIIGRTRAFDAKIYKIVGGIFDVSVCRRRSKKFFKIFAFCFQLPALLIDFCAENRQGLEVRIERRRV
jgi:hypothetical protein